MMKIIIHFILLCTISTLTQAEDKKAGTGLSATQELAEIQQRDTEAETAYRKATQSLPNTPEGNNKSEELWNQFDKEQANLFIAAAALARANPKSEIGFAALEWLLKSVRAYYLPAGALGLELMTNQYADHPKIGNVIAVLAYYLPSEDAPSYRPAVDLLKAVVQKNPDRTARGQAVLGLAWIAKRDFQRAESEANPETERLAAQAKTAFESILRDYGDSPNLRTVGARPATSTLGGEAAPELYELLHLRIGQAAPQIEGKDLDGARLKLSNYRGKVVLLVFWASWCGPCMADVPHEKALVEAFKGRPFVLVGVNGDSSKTDAARAVEEHEVSWHSFWNGKEGAGGPIAVAWNVRGWPAVYVIDHNGVIRYKYLRGKGLDDPLEKLVSAAEKG